MKLNENQLRAIIRESVKNILKENYVGDENNEEDNVKYYSEPKSWSFCPSLQIARIETGEYPFDRPTIGVVNIDSDSDFDDIYLTLPEAKRTLWKIYLTIKKYGQNAIDDSTVPNTTNPEDYVETDTDFQSWCKNLSNAPELLGQYIDEDMDYDEGNEYLENPEDETWRFMHR